MAYTKKYKISFGCTDNNGSTDYFVEVDTKGDSISEAEYTAREEVLKNMITNLNKALEQGQPGWGDDQHRFSFTTL
tara:strand:- start:1270 stop:1497 length:228 start_codon:yes stop_codon:yes gene_type:complete